MQDAETYESAGRVIYKCPACKAVKAVDYQIVTTLRWYLGRMSRNKQVFNLDGTFAHHPEYRACECGKAAPGKWVLGTVNPAHKCDGRCLNAKNSSCECACGGENHGKNHL